MSFHDFSPIQTALRGLVAENEQLLQTLTPERLADDASLIVAYEKRRTYFFELFHKLNEASLTSPTSTEKNTNSAQLLIDQLRELDLRVIGIIDQAAQIVLSRIQKETKTRDQFNRFRSATEQTSGNQLDESI